MAIKATEISDLIKQRIESFKGVTEARNVGTIVSVTDGICRIHGLADARAVLGIGQPVTLLSAPAAAQFAGCGWWRAVIEQVRRDHAAVPMTDILDCADASGLALGALRIGQRRLVLHPAARGWRAVAVRSRPCSLL